MALVALVSGPLWSRAAPLPDWDRGPLGAVMGAQMAFVANMGQFSPRVRYRAQVGSLRVALTPTAAMVVPTAAGGGTAAGAGEGGSSAPTGLALRFLGADPEARTLGEVPLPSTVSYFNGSDPARWRPPVPAYRQVRCHHIYPRVDAVWSGTSAGLRYDLRLDPGADVSSVIMRLDGARGASLEKDGSLRVVTDWGTYRQAAPYAYQEIGTTRLKVASGYVLDALSSLRFRLGSYDHGRPLVIDPTLDFSNALGGSGFDLGSATAVDAAGNIYVAGNTTSNDLPISPQAAQRVAGGGGVDAFVAKLNPSGTTLEYLTYLGGDGSDGARAIAVDQAGNAYVTGYTSSANFPVTPGALQTSPRAPGAHAFAVKLNPSGTRLLYSTYLGGSGTDSGTGIAVDNAGRATIAGSTGSSDFPVTPGVFQAALRGRQSGFVTRLDPTGSMLISSTLLGGTGVDEVSALAVDGTGSTYVTGSTTSADFPVSPGAFASRLRGAPDAFVTKLNPAGTALSYSTYLGGGADSGLGVAVDANGAAYVTGITGSPDFPVTPGVLRSAVRGVQKVFVTKVDPLGSILDYSLVIGGGSNQRGTAIGLDGRGDAFVTGYTDSPDFPLLDPLQAHKRGPVDAFVFAVNPGATALLYSTYLGGSGSTQGKGIAVDSTSTAFVTGFSDAPDFPKTGRSLHAPGSGNAEVFVARVGLEGSSIVPVKAPRQMGPPRTGALGLAALAALVVLLSAIMVAHRLLGDRFVVKGPSDGLPG